MKNIFYFICSFLTAVLMMVSCDKAFAIKGTESGGVCYAYWWNIGTYNGTSMWRYTNGGYFYLNGNFLQASATSGSFGAGWQYVSSKTYAWEYHIGSYQWIQKNTSSPSMTTVAKDQAVASLESLGLEIPQNTYPSQYWPTGPPEGCQDPSVNCSELVGQSVENIFVSGVKHSGDICFEECKATITSGTIYPADQDGDGTSDDYTLILSAEYTGDDCNGETEGEPDERDCNEKQAECEALCIGGDMDFSCDAQTGQYSCGCELPPYPVTPNSNGDYKPDQDMDGTGSDTDPDVDGDGTNNGDDSDVDGDGTTNRTDQDVDGDAQDNRGNFTWTNDNWPPHNGVGADPDIDGDGQPNSTDDDIDGDGIPNGNDPDIDGDGVLNSSDLDADGDGILDGSDPDADGDGLVGGDDPDSDGSGPAAGDTDGDGDVDSDDPPAAEPTPEATEEEVQQGYDNVSENIYDSTIEGDFEDPDLGGIIQGFIDLNPFADDLVGSEVQLNNIDSCLVFPNPFREGNETFCFNVYDTHWRIMGFLLVGLTGFLCFRLIVWRY